MLLGVAEDMLLGVAEDMLLGVAEYRLNLFPEDMLQRTVR